MDGPREGGIGSGNGRWAFGDSNPSPWDLQFATESLVGCRGVP